jgi:hypothetical protein
MAEILGASGIWTLMEKTRGTVGMKEPEMETE